MTDNSHNTDLCLNIVDRVEQRDPVFLQALIEQAEKIAQRQVVRHGLPRDYALDVAQEALRRIMQRPERLAHIQDFRAYLQVLIHRITSELVRNKQSATARPIELEEVSLDVAVDPELKASLVKIKDVVNTLAPRQREVFLLRFSDNRTYAEIGLLLGISQSAVCVRLHRALKQLRMVLQEDAPSSVADSKLGTTAGPEVT